MSIPRPACLWLALTVSLACSSEPETYGAARYEGLSRAASLVRELRFVNEVPIREISHDEFDDERVPYTPEQVERLHQTWGRFGYFGPHVDIDAATDDADDRVAGYYRSDTGEITIVGSPSNETIVHEYVHALQDQHFDLVAIDEAADSTDAFLARRAVVEGDATLAESRYHLASLFRVDLDQVDWARALAAHRETVDSLLAEAEGPVYSLAYSSFTYAYGQEYALEMLTGSTLESPQPTRTPPYDWSDNNAAFAGPPSSTIAILSRDEALVPPTIGLQTVPLSVQDRLSAVGHDRIGAWMIYLLWYPLGAPERAFELVLNWRSDRLLFVQDTTSEQVGFVWTTRWTTPVAAAQAAANWWLVHGGADDGVGHGASTNGEALYLQQRGTDVVAMRNVDPALAPTIADESLAGTRADVTDPAVETRSAALRADFIALLERNKRGPAPQR
ncbi:MAG: hypothetical protein B7733_07420 [Myxococcales bacterium FL481]|nr:MAG: hypothetical protein B7733_07420 [Myxococcales bacterium FL481]